MTALDLEPIKQRSTAHASNTFHGDYGWEVSAKSADDVPALIAEVARLRAEMLHRAVMLDEEADAQELIADRGAQVRVFALRSFAARLREAVQG